MKKSQPKKQKTVRKDSKNSRKSLVAKNGKKTKSSLKRSTQGFEVEFFILDKNGRVVNEADRLLKKLAEKKRNPDAEITKEIGKNQIEIGSYPSIESINTLKALLENLKLLLYTIL